jgi:hypothetical protein
MASSAPRSGARPAVALVGSYELPMVAIGGAPTSAARGSHDGATGVDPPGEQAAVVFADGFAAGRVSSIRAIRAALDVGQPPGTAAARLLSYSRWKAGRKVHFMSI